MHTPITTLSILSLVGSMLVVACDLEDSMPHDAEIIDDLDEDNLDEDNLLADGDNAPPDADDFERIGGVMGQLSEEDKPSSEDDEHLPDPLVETLRAGGNQNGNCHCYTTCSSNGNGWTKTYYVGHAGGQGSCSNKAHDFCKDLHKSYKFHNSACT